MGHSKVGIVNYGVGNLRSVANAVSHVGSEVVVSSDPTVLGDCSHLVLPGVGSFPHGISALAERNLDNFLRDYVESDRPCLGICLGMQLLMEYSTEFTKTAGLGFLPGSVEHLGSLALGSEGTVRLPNVGWLSLKLINTNEPMAARMFSIQCPKTNSTLFTHLPLALIAHQPLHNQIIVASHSHLLWPMENWLERNSTLKKAVKVD